MVNQEQGDARLCRVKKKISPLSCSLESVVFGDGWPSHTQIHLHQMLEEVLFQKFSSAAHEITSSYYGFKGQMQANQAGEKEAAIDSEKKTGAVYLGGMQVCVLLSEEDAVPLHEETPKQRSRHS